MMDTDIARGGEFLDVAKYGAVVDFRDGVFEFGPHADLRGLLSVANRCGRTSSPGSTALRRPVEIRSTCTGEKRVSSLFFFSNKTIDPTSALGRSIFRRFDMARSRVCAVRLPACNPRCHLSRQ